MYDCTKQKCFRQQIEQISLLFYRTFRNKTVDFHTEYITVIYLVKLKDVVIR